MSLIFNAKDVKEAEEANATDVAAIIM